MKTTKVIMGMPITVEVIDELAAHDIRGVFGYFKTVDRRYSTYKPDSEISRINKGLREGEWTAEMQWVLGLCEETKRRTDGYFDIEHDGAYDPSGLVKGWAIQNAANLLLLRGRTNFYIEAGGDVQAHGHNASGETWHVGIRNPFQTDEIIKIIRVHDAAVATSGAYIRGDHIYNPFTNSPPRGVASLSVVGPTIYDADRFATAAYAMGEGGIAFIENTAGLEGYMVDDKGTATYTSGFERYVA